MAAVKPGMSLRKASMKFGVQRRTVRNHTSRKIAHFNKSKNPSMLSEDEEEAVVEYIQCMASRNIPLKRNDLHASILVCFAVTSKPNLS